MHVVTLALHYIIQPLPTIESRITRARRIFEMNNFKEHDDIILRAEVLLECLHVQGRDFDNSLKMKSMTPLSTTRVSLSVKSASYSYIYLDIIHLPYR